MHWMYIKMYMIALLQGSASNSQKDSSSDAAAAQWLEQQQHKLSQRQQSRYQLAWHLVYWLSSGQVIVSSCFWNCLHTDREKSYSYREVLSY